MFIALPSKVNYGSRGAECCCRYIALRWSATSGVAAAINIWPRRGQYTITPLRSVAEIARSPFFLVTSNLQSPQRLGPIRQTVKLALIPYLVSSKGYDVCR
jgi:hypothetical protein